MAGGTQRAVELALGHGGVAFNVGGGLHHAFRDHGERFCLINDVAAAIAEARDAGFAAPVLVVDCDLHDGDGTRNVFAADPTVHTFSIHNASVGHRPGRRRLDLDRARRRGRRRHPARHPPRAPAAGGRGGAPGPGGVRRRHRRRRRRLAGRLADERRGDLRPRPLRHPPAARRAGAGAAGRRPRRRLRPRRLALQRPLSRLAPLRRGDRPPGQRAVGAGALPAAGAALPHRGADRRRARDDDGWSLTEEDVLGPLAGVPVRRRFLGYYSPHGVELALERTGPARPPAPSRLERSARRARARQPGRRDGARIRRPAGARAAHRAAGAARPPRGARLRGAARRVAAAAEPARRVHRRAAGAAGPALPRSRPARGRRGAPHPGVRPPRARRHLFRPVALPPGRPVAPTAAHPRAAARGALPRPRAGARRPVAGGGDAGGRARAESGTR